MDIQKNKNYIEELWDNSILSTLTEYIRIPNKSSFFDPDWQQHGFMEKAVDLITSWCRENSSENMQIEVSRIKDRTPLILIEIPGEMDETILLYGHLDKQPEMAGWDSDLGPWKPVLKDEKLYGRGGADDGYAVFASLAAIKSLHQQKIPHARCIILIEASEESGSCDLPFHIEALEKRIGDPSLIICLDSGCGNYDQLWVSTSLRGLVGGMLTIEVLKQGVHSGAGSGIVPSCFLILRQLIDRIESVENGAIVLKDLYVDIPKERAEQAKDAAFVLGRAIYDSCSFHEGIEPLVFDAYEQILNRTWRPAFSFIGADGIPSSPHAGNVTLPSISAKLSMRLPPTCDAEKASLLIKNIIETDPPYHAKIKFDIKECATGWNAPKTAKWLVDAANQASQHYYGADAMYIGEGGSIPFMGMLGKKFPKAQFLITGVLGPGSNAHGPNEFLHIPTVKKLTCCVAEVIESHFKMAIASLKHHTTS